MDILHLLTCMILVTADMVFSNSEGIICPGNNQSEELSFTIHPETGLHFYIGRPIEMICCATGYSDIVWYKEGVQLPPKNERELDSTNGKQMWSETITDASGEIVTVNFTCVVYSVDGRRNISNTVTLWGRPYPNEPDRGPQFTIAEMLDCENDKDVTIRCALNYTKEKTTIARRINLLHENQTAIALNETTRNKIEFTLNLSEEYVEMNVTIKNVEKEWLNRSYFCQAQSNLGVKSAPIFIPLDHCTQPVSINTTLVIPRESNLSLRLAVPLAVLLILIIVGVAMSVRFNAYLIFWYKIKVIQKYRPQKGEFSYQAYMIYSDVEHEVVNRAMSDLENNYKLNICLPERDFEIGLVTPELISEGIKSSEKVIAFLSNDMFREDDNDDNWSDISLSLAIALNKPLIIVLLEEIDVKLLSKRKYIKAALKVVGGIKPFTPEFDEVLSTAFQHHFKFVA